MQMRHGRKKNVRHYTAADTAAYYRYLKDAAYLTEKVYKEWLTHPNHELIAKLEAENTSIPEDLQKRLDGFKKRGAQLYGDMIAAKKMLERRVARLGRAKVRKSSRNI